MVSGVVDFTVSPETVYDYLVDPLERPEWQSSLRAVELLDQGPVAEGTRWVDVTQVGVKPRMVLTRAERPTCWVEFGEWGIFTAELTLTFTPTPSGCQVAAEFEVHARGVAPLGTLVTAIGRRPVLADLRRAAAILDS